MDPVELLKEKLLLACKIFQSQKLFDGFGHVTVRGAEDRILSTPKMPLCCADTAPRWSVMTLMSWCGWELIW